MPWTVYLVRCADDSLYTGIARDLSRRLRQHDDGKGAKYTRGRGPVTLLWSERKRTQGSALRREAEIKGWPRGRKLLLAPAPARRASVRTRCSPR